MTTIIVFALILSFLIFVHELGHFVTAKKVGVVVEEFGIGYPPRAVKLWQDEGKITLDGHDFIIGKKTSVPKNLQTGGVVAVETRPRDDGQIEVTHIELFDPEEDDLTGKITTTVEALEKPTEYTLNWIPFGGFVKMLGEEDPSAPGSFASKSKKARFVVLVAGATMNLITAVVMFSIMFMTGQPESIGPTYVTDVVPKSPADQAGLQPNDFIIRFNGQDVESATDLVAMTHEHLGENVTLTLQRGDTELQTSLIPRKDPPPGEGAMGVGIRTQYTQLLVKDVTPGSVAGQAGLQIGDLIFVADGQPVDTPSVLQSILHTQAGQSVAMRVLRGDNRLTLSLPVPTNVSNVDPAASPLADAVSQSIPAIGAEVVAQTVEQRITHVPPGQAFVMGASATAGIVVQTFTIPVAIIKRIIPAEQARPVGPYGIYQITDSAVEVSQEQNVIYPILFLTGLLSAAIAVTNLLPLPALDGGRILFIFIEAIRGKRVPPEKEGAIHFIGMALLLMLMVVISYYDVTAPLDTSGLFR